MPTQIVTPIAVALQVANGEIIEAVIAPAEWDGLQREIRGSSPAEWREVPTKSGSKWVRLSAVVAYEVTP